MRAGVARSISNTDAVNFEEGSGALLWGETYRCDPVIYCLTRETYAARIKGEESCMIAFGVMSSRILDYAENQENSHVNGKSASNDI